MREGGGNCGIGGEGGQKHGGARCGSDSTVTKEQRQEKRRWCQYESVCEARGAACVCVTQRESESDGLAEIGSVCVNECVCSHSKYNLK